MACRLHHRYIYLGYVRAHRVEEFLHLFLHEGIVRTIFLCLVVLHNRRVHSSCPSQYLLVILHRYLQGCVRRHCMNIVESFFVV